MNKSSQTIERKFPIELRIVVWEFVRIMVQLEKSTKSKNHKNSLSIYHAWLAAWHEIDDRLTESGKKDVSEFSELMMEKEVLLQSKLRQETDSIKKREFKKDNKNLIPFGFKVFSQTDEDGIINEIFNRIGATNKQFFEFGEDTKFNNTTYIYL